ncbi:MAG TPA: SDR family NAD(P)-dependent oxidoreductase [Candidatus Barnesiella excrementavium]|nr:SDR family NAD(P)-dependent oxidoreductase [Candidatus Barnesiella excrementavium]
MTRNRDLSPCTALVTGSSSGIGLEFARQLAAWGAALVMVSIDRDDLDREAARIAADYRVPVDTLCMDLARPEAADELYRYCRDKGLVIDILVNNAGIFSFREVIRTDPARIETMIQLHMGTVTRLSRLFAADMCQRHHGYLLNMSSLSCWTPYPGIALYTATKAYIRVFTRALAYELSDYGVHATVVCPGGVATGLYGLPPRLLRLGVRLGILMPPERLVRKALNALFRGKKQLIPGLFNRLLIPLASVMPTRVRLIVKHRMLDE